jgi:tetratricopeptide (TPR) repeat protein
MKTSKTLQLTGVIIIILLSFSASCFAQKKPKKNDPSSNLTSDNQTKIVSFDLTSDKDKEALSMLLRSCWIFSNDHTVSYKEVEINSDNISVISDKKNRITINFSDLDYALSVSKQNWEQHYKGVKYFIQFGDNCTFNYDRNNYGKARELCNILYTLQHRVNLKNTESLLIAFKPLAGQYHDTNPKPAISEEQRKYIVQANLFSEGKDYKKAIATYNKVLDVNPIAYPAAYYNLSLLYAQESFFDRAILNMKKYLLLLPDAPDARAAQDKIYEWETNFAN